MPCCSLPEGALPISTANRCSMASLNTVTDILSPGNGHLHRIDPLSQPGSFPNVKESRVMLPRHLRRLEAECIHILREVAAEFDKPVMLYSIGKDLS